VIDDNFINLENLIGNSRPYILIVDDTAIILRNIKSLLDSRYSVAVAPSGRHALQSIKKHKPDLILLDYDMPEMNGKEVMKILKASPDTQDIPVVFLTAMDSRETVLELLTLEPAGYLLKPVNSAALFDTIYKILGR